VCTQAQAKESNMIATTPMVEDLPSELEDKCRKILKLEEEMVHQRPPQFANDVKDLTQEELDTLYARDMYQLSAKGRDEVLQDVHGVADAVDETPEFVQQKRSELLHGIDVLLLGKISSKKKHKTAAYELALMQDSAYVTSETLQLAFLRAERFDPKATALTLVQFFDAKFKLFGHGKLTKTITISDLSKEDKKSLESGFFQILPVRDVAGRAILCGMPMLRQYKTLENLVSSLLFIIHAESGCCAADFVIHTIFVYSLFHFYITDSRLFLYGHDGSGRRRDAKKGDRLVGLQHGSQKCGGSPGGLGHSKIAQGLAHARRRHALLL
jgi:hypothetical protein